MGIICHQKKWVDGFKCLIVKDLAGGSHSTDEYLPLHLPATVRKTIKKSGTTSQNQN
jgi:hypothetical protein